MSNALIIDRASLEQQRRWVRRLCLGLVRDPQLADEIAGDALAASLNEAQPRPEAWWRSVVLNRLRMHRRQEARLRERAELGHVERTVAAPENVVGRLEAHRRVVDAVLTLPEPYRETVVLHFHEGLSCAAIARRLDVPASTVRNRLARALEKLRERLGGEEEDWYLAIAPILSRERSVPWAGLAGALLFVLIASVALGTNGFGLLAGDVEPQDETVTSAAAADLAGVFFLEVELTGDLPDDYASVEVLVHDQAGGPVLTVPATGPRVEIDVSSLVDPTALAQELDVAVDSPGHLWARGEAPVRTHVGARGAVPEVLRLELSPRAATVEGAVQLPAGETSYEGVEIALFDPRAEEEDPGVLRASVGSPNSGPTGAFVANTLCDRDGTYELPTGSTGPHLLVAWRRGRSGVDRAALAPRTLQVDISPGHQTLQPLPLDRGAVISGRVERPQPSAERAVELFAFATGGRSVDLDLRLHGGEFHLGTTHARTEPDGRFTITGLRRGMRYEIERGDVFHEGGAITADSRISVTAPRVGVVFPEQLRMVELTLVGPHGPLEGARVTHGSGQRVPTQRITDGLGRVFLEVEPGTTTSAQVDADGYRQRELTFLVDTVGEAVTESLVPLDDPQPASLSIRVGPNGPGGVMWSAYAGHENRGSAIPIGSGLVRLEDGFAELDRLPPGPITLAVIPHQVVWGALPYWFPTMERIDAAPGETLVVPLELRRGGRILGPVGASIEVAFGEAGYEDVPLFTQGLERFVPAGRSLSRVLEPGEHTVRVTGPEGAREVVVTVVAGQTTEIR